MYYSDNYKIYREKGDDVIYFNIEHFDMVT